MPNTQEYIDLICQKRGLPEIKRGTPCEVDGRKGIIVGGNSSANLNVLFEDCPTVRNCHPGYKMRIFNPWGGVMYESEDIYNQANQADPDTSASPCAPEYPGGSGFYGQY